MTTQDSQAVGLHFDEAKSFSENCEAFLSNVEKFDVEMAAILRDNWRTVIAIVRDGQRDSKTRIEFNTKVAAALDVLVRKAQPKDGA